MLWWAWHGLHTAHLSVHESRRQARHRCGGGAAPRWSAAEDFCWRHGPPIINALMGLARPAHSAPIGPRNAAIRPGTGAGAMRHRDGAPQRILLAPWPADHKRSGGPGTACTQRTYRSTTPAVRPGTGAGAVRHRDGAPQRILLAAWPAGHKRSGGPGTARTQRTYRSTTPAVRPGTGAGAVRHRDGAPQRILLAPWPPVINALVGLARPAHSAPIGPRLPLSGAAPVRGRCGTAMERRRGFCWRHGRRS